ncbi:MAG: type II toxin-antitoxin system Phd/YefM family antitoxin [Clostridiales bacterium]|jgi:uncharacterized protein (DUF342 family)|nr:type II toxin-antitoxin system Phd/YefM family antitoxin [Clostridiales bacterium]MDR2711991.1 type II toxin-antitoxin system Phd/YefM family antitoxin [Clostridiales bacterium]
MSSYAIPVLNLKDTDTISKICSESEEPLFVADGEKELVIMSAKSYREKLFMADIYKNLAEAEADVAAGRTVDAFESIQRIREKHNV